MGLLFAHSAWIDICDVFIMLSSVSRFNFHCTVHNGHFGQAQALQCRSVFMSCVLFKHCFIIELFGLMTASLK